MTDRSRVAVVTGSGGAGCGRAIARRFARDGLCVTVSDVDEAGGHATVRAIERDGGRAAFCRADIRDEAQARELTAFAVDTFGGVDVLINNASAPHPPTEGIAGWFESLQTDLVGTLHVTRYAIDAMRARGGGSIVGISSISALWNGRTTPGGFPGYDVAKAGVIRMTTGLAREMEAMGIRINCLAPGWIDSDGPRQYWESLTPQQRIERGVPSRLLTTTEIADIVARIADDRTLNGRLVVWWSEDRPRLVAWGDRGYRDFTNF
ncbi:MAG TPA: SDR family NAD(P)-dependent oxidoreductase [Vicinamibacterales bacterium]|nr:SDR family NAD(P)-dependent oxidoreductase [Vicinamibacterales bacterium]